MNYPLRVEDMAYWAGLFDGEGSIFISKQWNNDGHHKNPNHILALCICMTDKQIIYDWKTYFEVGYITQRNYHRSATPNAKDSWAWTVKGNKAMQVLKMLQHYLRVKSEQAKIGIEFQTNKTVQICKQLTPDEIVYRETMRQRLKKLNAKGRIEEEKICMKSC